MSGGICIMTEANNIVVTLSSVSMGGIIHQQWRSISEKSINRMLENGVISADIVNQVRNYLQSYRNNQ